jgi:hypothetical protein
MKRLFVILLLGAGAAAAYAQERLPLDTALGAAVSHFTVEAPFGTRLLPLSIGAPAEALSAYATDNLSSRLLSSGAFSLVERDVSVVRGIEAEIIYQRSGLVEESTVQALGERSGAQAVLSGAIIRAGTEYRLTLKITSVEKAETLSIYTVLLQQDDQFRRLAASPGGINASRPAWIMRPLEGGRPKYENTDAAGVSQWYYDVGISTKTTTEQRARQRATQNVQANIAATVASDFSARLDITEYSLFNDCDVEDASRLVETAITNSIKTRVPRYEPLEWYIETGFNAEGREWYTAYVLVRFPRKDILDMVEKMDPAGVVDALIAEAVRQKIIAQSAGGDNAAKAAMLDGVLAAREYAKESIADGLTGN